MLRASAFVSLALVAFSGCGGNELKKFPVAEVTGYVTCDGEPVPFARLFFEPLQVGKKAMVGKPGYATADAEGFYAISTYRPKDGAVVGRHRVRVDRPHPDEVEKFECNCVTGSEIDVMEVDIASGEKNFIDVELKLKTGREPKSKIRADE